MLEQMKAEAILIREGRCVGITQNNAGGGVTKCGGVSTYLLILGFLLALPLTFSSCFFTTLLFLRFSENELFVPRIWNQH